MAIMKLGDVCEIQMCTRVLKEQRNKNGDIPFYKISTFGSNPDEYISLNLFNELMKNSRFPNVGEIMLSCSGTIGKMVIYNGEKCFFQDSNIVWLKNNESKILNKYLFFSLKKINFNRLTSGSTIKRLYNEEIKKIELCFPSLEEQQQIIDIIEPFEKLMNHYNMIIHILERINNKIFSIKSPIVLGKFITNDIKLEKGIVCKNGNYNEECQIPFINVSAINGRINKFVNNNLNTIQNVQYGDIILSLDATVGLVNNVLKGINGYGYKVFSKKWENWQIYYSLLNDINKKIINKYCHGTTIKHATKSKDKLLLLDYEEYNIILKMIYEIDFLLKLSVKNLRLIIDNLVKNLIY